MGGSILPQHSGFDPPVQAEAGEKLLILPAAAGGHRAHGTAHQCQLIKHAFDAWVQSGPRLVQPVFRHPRGRKAVVPGDAQSQQRGAHGDAVHMALILGHQGMAKARQHALPGGQHSLLGIHQGAIQVENEVPQCCCLPVFQPQSRDISSL